VKINSIVFPSYNSSDGISVDIFLSGCNREPKCKNCHNPELWNFDNGNDINYEEIIRWLKIKNELFDNVIIMGGEPLDQKDLVVLLEKIYKIKPIWLYTSYELDEIPKQIEKYCSYIKTGRYDETQLSKNNIVYGIKLASKNQKIYKITEENN
jgi:anaerobic ribonucleoside-triphosphate reductase activating protein